MKTFNPYKIVWSIEVSENKPVVFNHFPDIESLKSSIKLRKNTTVYVITDKQFGLIQNSYNGIEKELPKPFTQKIINKNGKLIQVIPLTTKQFNNPITL